MMGCRSFYRVELSPAAFIPIAPGLAESGTPAEMIRRRPDLLVAERRLAAANARIGMAISEYYPKFSLGALLGSATAVSSGNLFTTGANQAQGVLGLRWRLFDFGRVDAQIAAARGQEAEALAAYRLAVLPATEEVENSFAALVKREAQVASSRREKRRSRVHARTRLPRTRVASLACSRFWMPTATCCRCATRKRRRKPKLRAPPLPPSGLWVADGMRAMPAAIARAPFTEQL
jgi:hypothetical protein